MKRNLFISLLLAISSLFIISSCDDGKKEPVGPVTPDNVDLIIGTTEINAPFETDPDFVFQISYKLQNAPEGTEISVSNPVDWIYDLDLSKKGEIDFKVTRNQVPEVREATLTVTCPGVEKPAEIHVIQEIGKPYPFVFDVREITKTNLDASVLPLDKEDPYMALTADSTIMAHCVTDEDIFNDDMALFEEWSKEFGVSVPEIIEMFQYVGDQDISTKSLMPGTAYLSYAYHLDAATVSLTSEVVKLRFKTEPVQMIDAKFEFETLVDGCYMICECTPVDYDGWYFFDMLQGVEEGASADEINNAIVSQYMEIVSTFKAWGMSDEEILEGLCKQGVADIDYDLDANSIYVIFALAVDSEALACSVPSTESFKTDPVEASDNKITIEVSDVKSRSANLKFTTTTNDPYAIYVFAKDYYDGELANRPTDELKEILVKNIGFTTSGDYEQVITGLDPETEFIVVAMGTEGGMATTDLFTETFKTTEAKKSDTKIDMKFDGFYSIDEVNKLDEQYAAGFGKYEGKDAYTFPFTILVEPSEGATLWYGFWDEATLEDPEVTDQMVMDKIMSKEPREPYDGYNLGICYDGDRLVFTVVVEDAEGGLTDLWKSPALVIDKAEAGDPEYFVKNYPWPYATSSASVASFADRSLESEIEGLGMMEFVDTAVSPRAVNVADEISLLGKYDFAERSLDNLVGKPIVKSNK